MESGLTLAQAQAQVDAWINSIGQGYFSELCNLGVLMEEVGEMARIMVRRYGEQSFKKDEEARQLSEEMADVFWVLLCLANQTGVNLSEAFQQSMEKKTRRDAQRHLNNEKLRRK